MDALRQVQSYLVRQGEAMTGRTCRAEAQRRRKSDVWEWALIGWPVTIIGAAGFAWLIWEVLK
jgi:hypothetical protein